MNHPVDQKQIPSQSMNNQAIALKSQEVLKDLLNPQQAFDPPIQNQDFNHKQAKKNERNYFDILDEKQGNKRLLLQQYLNLTLIDQQNICSLKETITNEIQQQQRQYSKYLQLESSCKDAISCNSINLKKTKNNILFMGQKLQKDLILKMKSMMQEEFEQFNKRVLSMLQIQH